MTLFPSSRPGIRARVLPKFPALVEAGPGLSVEKASGVYTIAPDLGSLTETTEVSDTAAAYLWLWDEGEDVHSRVPISFFIETLMDEQDQDINALAALTGTGFAARTADDTWALRSLTVGTGLSIANPAGVAGDPQITLDAELVAFAGLTSAADTLGYFTGSGTMSTTSLTAAGRALIDDATAAAQLTTLGVSSFVQTLVDDTTAAAFMTTLGISAFVQTLLDDANAAAARTTLGLAIGTDVQAYDADLATLAAMTAWRLPYANGSSVITQLAFGAAGTVLTSAGASSAPVFSVPPTLAPLQTTYATSVDLSTQLPADDTVPQSTEGDQILSQAITPTSSSKRVRVVAAVNVARGATGTPTLACVALFRDSTCIAATVVALTGTTTPAVAVIDYIDSPASASAVTYSVRVGPGSSSQSVRCNTAGGGTGRIFGGSAVCTLTVQQVD